MSRLRNMHHWTRHIFRVTFDYVSDWSRFIRAHIKGGFGPLESLLILLYTIPSTIAQKSNSPGLTQKDSELKSKSHAPTLRYSRFLATTCLPTDQTINQPAPQTISYMYIREQPVVSVGRERRCRSPTMKQRGTERQIVSWDAISPTSLRNGSTETQAGPRINHKSIRLAMLPFWS